ncbi:hypothetical protein D9613_000139 [Agrocybe pediades]|uniref:Uncharacterized protein n=1 Tax=Agrocybe pediades TaxID=84607 RepID=A0A8H4VUQ0_9AGAR|nr:hypothetical protein D9613_000139 [Agrocybe pediades]
MVRHFLVPFLMTILVLGGTFVLSVPLPEGGSNEANIEARATVLLESRGIKPTIPRISSSRSTTATAGAAAPPIEQDLMHKSRPNRKQKLVLDRRVVVPKLVQLERIRKMMKQGKPKNVPQTRPGHLRHFRIMD